MNNLESRCKPSKYTTTWRKRLACALFIFFVFTPLQTEAQRAADWQQAVEYKMEIDMHAEKTVLTATRF